MSHIGANMVCPKCDTQFHICGFNSVYIVSIFEACAESFHYCIQCPQCDAQGSIEDNVPAAIESFNNGEVTDVKSSTRQSA